MGAYVNGVYVPTLAETGWDEEINDFLTRAGRAFIDVTLAPYGAVAGDGVDCTGAIQAAIDDAIAYGGGDVFIPPGTYKTTDVLTIAGSGVTLRGAGQLATHIHLNNATSGAILLDGDVAGISRVAVKDLTISCFATGPSRTAGYGIATNNVGEPMIENVTINHGWQGLYLDQCYSGTFRNIDIVEQAQPAMGGTLKGVYLARAISNFFDHVIVSSTASTGATGFEINGSVDTLVIRDSGVQGVTQFAYGIRLQNTIGGGAHDPRWVRVDDSYVEVDDTAGIGIKLGACYDVEFKGLYVKGGMYGANIGSGARYVRFIGGIIQLAQQYGILVDACDGLDIANMLITDNGQLADNTYDGIIVAPGCSNFTFSGVRAGDLLWNGTGAHHYQRYGINVLAGSTNYRIVACDARNNRTGGVNDAGTGAVESFYNTATPIVKQTGVAVTDAAIHAALVNLGLISA